MASTTVARLTQSSLQPPNRGTFAANANTLYPKGTIVTRDADGRAVSPSTADVSGFPAMGVANHTYDNRTSNPAGNGGLDDSIDVEVSYGVFAFDISGSTPLPGDKLYVVDNQTLSVDEAGGRGFAGFCTEVRDDFSGTAQAYCLFGPHVAAASGIQKVSATITDDMLTDSDGAQTFNVGAALPANAVVLTHAINVTEAFTDGAAGTFTLDVGDTDVDAIVDGAALGTIAVLNGPLGVQSGGRYGGVQITATVLADVNVDTATAGSVTVEIFYTVLP